MRKRRVGVLIVIRQHGGENRRDAKVGEEDDGEGGDDGYGDAALRALGLLPRSRDAVETDEAVEAGRRARYHARDAVGHEAAAAIWTISLRAAWVKLPVVEVGWRK